MKHVLTKALLVVCSTLSLNAFACSFDTDCEPGSRCLKRSGQLYGVCFGGMSPGNSNDRAPVRDILDPNQTVGNTCSFDMDCGPGSFCAKSRGNMDGVCLRRR